MGGTNPTIVATITAEDKSKAAVETATAALRELNKTFRQTGADKLPPEMLNGLDKEVARATSNMNKLREKTGAVRGEAQMLRTAFSEAFASLKPLAEMMAGMKVAEFGKGVMVQAGESAHAEILNAYAGMTPEQIDKSKAETLDLQKKYPGLSITSGQHIAGSLYSVMGNDKEAEELFPKLMEYRAAQRARHPEESDERIDERVHSTVKFGEAVGANTSSEALGALLDKIQRVENFEGRMIKPDDLLGMSKQGGAYLKMLNDQGMKTAVQLVAEWGGDRTGTFLQSIGKYSAGSGFDNHASALTELADAGIVKDEDLIKNKQGKPTGIKQGSDSLLKFQQLSADPLAFVRETLLGATDKMWREMSDKERAKRIETFNKNYAEEVNADPSKAFLDANGRAVDTSKMDPKQLFEFSEVRRMFPNSVAARGLSEALVQLEPLLAKAQKIDKANDVDQTLATSGKDPVVQLHNLQQSLENFQTVLGGPLMEPAAEALHFLSSSIASFVDDVAALEKKYPTVAKVTGGAIVAATTIGGTLAAYNALSGLVKGVFGSDGSGKALTASATALDNSAAALTAAAEKLSVASGVPATAAPATMAETAIASGAAGATATGVTAGEVAAGGFVAAAVGYIAYQVKQWGDQKQREFGLTPAADIPMPKALSDAIERFENAVRETTKNAPTKPTEPAKGGTPFSSSALPDGMLNLAPVPVKPVSQVAPLAPIAPPAKPTEVQGTVSGQAEIHNSMTIDLSPELKAQIKRSTSVGLPLAGRVGTVMGGANGVPSANGGHFTE